MTDSARQTDASTSAAKKNEILLALIEHGTKPLAYIVSGMLLFLFFLMIKNPLVDAVGRANEIQLGGFVYRGAIDAGVIRELDALASLTTDQIQLFLIIGRRRPGSFISYDGPESNAENYERLREVGLIGNFEQYQDPDTGENRLSWRITDDGSTLHTLLMLEIDSAIKRAANAER